MLFDERHPYKFLEKLFPNFDMAILSVGMALSLCGYQGPDGSGRKLVTSAFGWVIQEEWCVECYLCAMVAKLDVIVGWKLKLLGSLETEFLWTNFLGLKWVINATTQLPPYARGS